MAKFKVGDKVTWQHHNGSLSNEVVKEVMDGGYRLEYGVAGERELYKGWVPEAAENKSNMTLRGGKWYDQFGNFVCAANAVRSTNAVVQNAVAARNALAANANMVPPDDPEAAKRFKAFEQKVASLRKEAQELDKYLVSKKQYGYSAYLEGIVKGLQ